jgi:hypothetical protein
VLAEVTAWQSRPLEAVYVVVFFDALRVKIREDAVVRNKAIYPALGVRRDGSREILGLWIETTESAKFWMKVFNDLWTRGVTDMLIAVTDGLKGMPEALSTAFPATTLQTCIAAATLVAELGDITRFANPRQLMAYLGLVPSEHSSGGTRRQGGITKAGISHRPSLPPRSHASWQASSGQSPDRRSPPTLDVLMLAEHEARRSHRTNTHPKLGKAGGTSRSRRTLVSTTSRISSDAGR